MHMQNTTTHFAALYNFVTSVYYALQVSHYLPFYPKVHYRI